MLNNISFLLTFNPYLYFIRKIDFYFTMNIKFEFAENPKKNIPQVIFLDDKKQLKNFHLEKDYDSLKKNIPLNKGMAVLNDGDYFILLNASRFESAVKQNEALRRLGSELNSIISSLPLDSIQLWGKAEELLLLMEGLLLSSYRFTKYKSTGKSELKQILLPKDKSINKEDLSELKHLISAVSITKDLVNEHAGYMTASQLGLEFKELGKEAGFKVEVLTKKRIESLKMGGLLAVNLGSVEPPTFSILEYKHEKAKNKKPIILVGKGVVYDTGGLSIKDSDSMSIMKCDMAGAAAVAGAFYAIAKNKLPVHVIGLIPSTDNRPGGNALAPGDVITISDGTTVEVLNTDAEGRLILADALSLAKKYKPELVIDLATLTGAAARAIGKEGIVYMGNASDKYKNQLEKSGNEVYERLVEFPLWEEYEKHLESDIADIKNIGGSEAGAITAGKFLEKFVDYEWLHLDIAGGAYLSAPDYYRSKNASGLGVRLLYHFIKSLK